VPNQRVKKDGHDQAQGCYGVNAWINAVENCEYSAYVYKEEQEEQEGSVAYYCCNENPLFRLGLKALAMMFSCMVWITF